MAQNNNMTQNKNGPYFFKFQFILVHQLHCYVAQLYLNGKEHLGYASWYTSRPS